MLYRKLFEDEKYPYIVPVNFGYIWKDGQLTLFFHGSKKSRKNTLIAKNPYVSFQCDCAHRLMLSQSESVCRTDFAYGSLMGCGKIEPLDGKEKAEALYCILEKYKVPQIGFAKAWVVSFVSCGIKYIFF